MSELLQGFGVFLGVVAGVFVTLGVQWVNNTRQSKQKLDNFRFELDFDIKKIDGWLTEITKYRNAVNGDAISMYSGYFDLSKVIYSTMNELFLSGVLYQHLGTDDIGNLLIIFNEFSIGGENILNNQITQNKLNFNKQDAVAQIDFWENKFKKHKSTLEQIRSTLSLSGQTKLLPK